MKKLILILLLCVLVTALCGCDTLRWIADPVV